MEDSVDYLNKITEETFSGDSKPHLVKKKPVIFSNDRNNISNEVDVCEIVTVKNEAVVNLNDSVNYSTKLKEEILCWDSKPLLVKDEPETFSIGTNTIYQPSNEVYASNISNKEEIKKNENTLNLKDVNKTVISTPIENNENDNESEDHFENERELSYSTSNTNKEPNYETTHFKISTLFRCHVCKKSFKWKSYLIRHMWIHSKETPYRCHVCGKCFTCESTLKNHMMIHTGETPYRCQVCGRLFREKGVLKRHMLIHTDEKPYICQVCKKACKHKGNLKQHMTIHTGERAYSCHFCEASFELKGHLTKHLLNHTEERKHNFTL